MTEIRIITTATEMRGIAQTWDAALLAAGCTEVSLTSFWLIRWLEYFECHGRARIVLGTGADGKINVQAAFLAPENRWAPVLTSLTNLYANRSAIVATGDGQAALAEWLAGQKAAVFKLGRFPNTDPHLQLTKGAMISRAFDLPVLDTTTSFASFLSEKSANFRKSFRRATKDQSALNTIVEKTPDTHIDAVFSISARTWKQDAGTAIVSSPATKSFYGTLLQEDTKGHVVRPFLVLMRKDNVPVGFMLGLVFNRVLHLVKMGYDTQIKKCSPGFGLLGASVTTACDNPDIDLIDLDALGPHGDYKMRWATDVLKLENTIAFSNSPRGRIARTLWRVKRKLKPIPEPKI